MFDAKDEARRPVRNGAPLRLHTKYITKSTG
jgi:hypothetical protein